MIVLPKIFASGALYLHSSPLEIRGSADAGAALSARILRGGEVLAEASAVADAEGAFVLPLRTPSASLLPSEIEISDGRQTLTLTDILFGELWFAAGQSNMSAVNVWQPEWREMLASLSGKAIRAFSSANLPHDGEYPIDPVDDTSGSWVGVENGDKFGQVSALATAFSSELYEYFCKNGNEIPVGFLNCNHGGTNIETWLPREVFDGIEELRHLAQDRENWNQKGGENYHQSCGHYNLNTHPLLGVKARGMLWYQGESNLWGEQRRSLYGKMLVALRESYAARFSPSEDDAFPIICSQIFPWQYREESDACIGYFNRIFTDLAKADPIRYAFVPLCDLSPIWHYHLHNHPIHPTHKYALGARFATLVLNRTYGRRGETAAATLRSCVRYGDRLRLTFDHVGSGLRLRDGVLRGLYVRSEKGAYTPAKCKIEGKRVLWVWADGVKSPRHAAYAVSTHEVELTLLAGDFAVAPFCTEFSEVTRNVTVNRKAWLDLSRDGEFVIARNFSDQNRDAGYRPVFYPCEGSELCFDPVSTGRRGLALHGTGERFGAYTVSRVGAALDLQNYASLSLSVYNAEQLAPTLILEYAEKEGKQMTLTLPVASRGEAHWGRQTVTFDLTELPLGEITKMTFAFKRVSGTVSLAVIDGISLVARC